MDEATAQRLLKAIAEAPPRETYGPAVNIPFELLTEEQHEARGAALVKIIEAAQLVDKLPPCPTQMFLVSELMWVWKRIRDLSIQ